VIRETLTLEADGAVLAGTLTLPESEAPAPLVVGVHGAEGGTRDFHLFRHLESTLPPAGLATLLFDRRGEGESAGDSKGVSYELLAADVQAWLRCCAADLRIDSGRIGLWGISQGGWIAPLAAAGLPETAFLVAVSPAGVTPGEQMAFATRALMRQAGYGDESVEQMLTLRRAMDDLSAGRLTMAEAQSLLDAAANERWFQLAFVPPDASLIDASWAEEMEFDIRPALRRLELPVLLFFGEHDRWIPVAESADVWRAELGTNADLTVLSLPGTGHAATFAADPDDWLEHGPVSPDYEHALLAWLRDRGLVSTKGD
jgi:pimeloyl-ACP methyl ester carboxylesterase